MGVWQPLVGKSLISMPALSAGFTALVLAISCTAVVSEPGSWCDHHKLCHGIVDAMQVALVACRAASTCVSPPEFDCYEDTLLAPKFKCTQLQV